MLRTVNKGEVKVLASPARSVVANQLPKAVPASPSSSSQDILEASASRVLSSLPNKLQKPESQSLSKVPSSYQARLREYAGQREQYT